MRVFAAADARRRSADFFGIDDPNFRGGARAAVGDLNGDGARRPGRRGRVRRRPAGGRVRRPALAGRRHRRKLFDDFFAFEPALRNGVYVAGRRRGRRRPGRPGRRRRPRRRPAGAGARRREPAPRRRQHRSLADFFAGDPAARGGVRVAVARGPSSPGAGRGFRRVTLYQAAGLTPVGTPAGTPLPGFEDDFAGGVYVG